MSNIDVLRTELTTDPLSRGYAGMTDAAASTDLNDSTTGRTRSLSTLSSATIYEALDSTEYAALDTGPTATVKDVIGLGPDVQVGPSSHARATLLAAFGAPSTTVANLVAVTTIPISRAEELEISARVGEVEEARR